MVQLKRIALTVSRIMLRIVLLGAVMVKRIMMMTAILGIGYSTYEIRIIMYYPIHVISIATYLSWPHQIWHYRSVYVSP